ncbi:DUF3885 domain-containing protein [Priestia megaterium]|nr:DUF3885 domain-containing protein [Priestia megaterium]
MNNNVEYFYKYIEENFIDADIKKPLFYNFPIGIRFELGNPNQVLQKNYMKQVYERSLTLFEEIFDENDEMYLMVYANRNICDKKKTQIFNHFLKEKSLKYNIGYKKLPFVHYEDDERWETRQFILKCKKHDLYYKRLLTAIANMDTLNVPAIKQDNECYFVNIDKGIIFHMYDDRGLDVVAKSIKTIEPLYTNYKNWILSYDREEIDSLFIK